MNKKREEANEPVAKAAPRVTFESITRNEEVQTYIKRADLSLQRMGFTEHSFAHVGRVSTVAGNLLHDLGYSVHIVELARIAGYLHDIGNIVNRIDHAQSGAIMAFRILDKLGMPCADVAKVISAIGNHDEQTAYPVNEVAAALIIADKTDVRRSRVRNKRPGAFDIHDRVNYAVIESITHLDTERQAFVLELSIDTAISPVIEYFEIFLDRMKLCRAAAAYLKLSFKLIINGAEIC